VNFLWIWLRRPWFGVIIVKGPEESRLNRTGNDVLTLLTEQGGRLHGLLFRLTLRAEVAEDLLQELFCKLAVSEGFRLADNAAAFAYRTATNLAFDWRRARKRNPTAETDGENVVTATPSALADLVRREELEQTLTAISDLSPNSRDIIVMHYLQQQSYETIAEQFGKTAHQVRALAHKAIKQLRRKLETEPKETAKTQRDGGKVK